MIGATSELKDMKQCVGESENGNYTDVAMSFDDTWIM